MGGSIGCCQRLITVIPAQAGIHAVPNQSIFKINGLYAVLLDSRIRGNDGR